MAELHRCRCRSCGSRRTLPRRPEHYHRQPPCRTCGRRDWRVDKYRARVELRRTPCLCHEYPFPHRKGSGFCILNAKMTEAEYLERRGVRAFS